MNFLNLDEIFLVSGGQNSQGQCYCEFLIAGAFVQTGNNAFISNAEFTNKQGCFDHCRQFICNDERFAGIEHLLWDGTYEVNKDGKRESDHGSGAC